MIDEWVKLLYIFIHTDIHTTGYSANISKDEIVLFAESWIEVEGIILRTNKSEKERQISDYLTHLWSLEKQK